jgi:hypothetical protein
MAMAEPTPPPPPENPLLPQVLFRKDVVGKYLKKDGTVYLPLTLLADRMALKYEIKGNSLVISGKSYTVMLLKKDDMDYLKMDDAKKVLNLSITYDEKAKKVFIVPADSK